MFNAFLPPQSNSSIIRAELSMFGVFIEAPASDHDFLTIITYLTKLKIV